MTFFMTFTSKNKQVWLGQDLARVFSSSMNHHVAIFYKTEILTRIVDLRDFVTSETSENYAQINFSHQKNLTA